MKTKISANFQICISVPLKRKKLSELSEAEDRSRRNKIQADDITKLKRREVVSLQKKSRRNIER